MPRVSLVALAIWVTSCAGIAGADVVSGGGCPTIDFERAGYTIRTARIDSPFTFLRWIRAAITGAQRETSALDGQPYRHKDVLARADELERLAFLPDAIDQRVRVSLVIVSVTNCADNQLDLVYTVLTSQVAPVLSGTFESALKEVPAPERASGADAKAGRVRFAPAVGYDRAEHFFGGARLEYRMPLSRSNLRPVESIVAEGRASDTMHEFSAAVSGGYDTEGGWLAHVDWQLGYLDTAEPTGPAELRQRRFSAQLAAITRPLAAWQLPLRFGGLLEGGRFESDFRGPTMPSDSVSNTTYGSAKLYLGTTTRLDRNVLTASYGLELGSTQVGAGIDWFKHILDLGHVVAIPVGDHRALTIESRLTGGLLQVPGTAPVNVRFFGGNREEPFIPGDAWRIRGNPVIRSIPANALNLSRDGAGGTRFVAYNLTAAIPIWRRPVVPSELSRDREFRSLLEGQLKLATSIIQTDYRSRDPHFRAAAARVGDVRTTLEALDAAVAVAEAAAAGQHAELFRECKRRIATAERRAKAATVADTGQVGNVAALLSVDEDWLRRVRADCVEALNAQLNDATIASQGAALERIRVDMEREYGLIDDTAATRQAEGEMTYVRRTLRTLIDDLNIIAVSPVLMFDFAHLGPADDRLGTRYGIGGGVRVTLANSLDLTVGYLANPKRLPNEAAGAFWFSMQFKDLFE